MKKYSILILLNFAGLVHAQQYYYPSSTTKYSYPGYQNDNYNISNASTDNPSNQEQSTPSNDANTEGEEKTAKQDSDKKEEEKPKSPHTFTGNLSIVSDYRFRGISQTMRHPAIQGGFDYAHTSGIYLGTWASNVDGTTHFYNNTSMEWDLYGGYKGKLFPCSIPDLGYNLGMIYYYYPGGKAQNPHNTRYNTGEFYFELSYKWLSVKYYQTITNYFGINADNTPFNWDDNTADPSNKSSRGSCYIEANATFDLMEKVCFRCFQVGKLNLLLHVGHQTVRHYRHLSYTDWKATLTQEFDWLNVFVSYVGTNAKHDYYDVPDNAFHPTKHALGAQGVVLGVIKTF